MINKICSTPSFTSNVKVVYQPEYNRLNQDFYQSDVFKKQIQKLKSNGENDTVIIYPYDSCSMNMQVAERINGTTYVGNSYIEFSPKNVAKAYENARLNMEGIYEDSYLNKCLV